MTTEYTTVPVSLKTKRACKARTFTGETYGEAESKVKEFYKKHPGLKEDGLYVCTKHWLPRRRRGATARGETDNG